MLATFSSKGFLTVRLLGDSSIDISTVKQRTGRYGYYFWGTQFSILKVCFLISTTKINCTIAMLFGLFFLKKIDEVHIWWNICLFSRKYITPSSLCHCISSLGNEYRFSVLREWMCVWLSVCMSICKYMRAFHMLGILLYNVLVLLIYTPLLQKKLYHLFLHLGSTLWYGPVGSIYPLPYWWTFGVLLTELKWGLYAFVFVATVYLLRALNLKRVEVRA